MDDKMQEIINMIIKRGNDVQIQRYADGVKIFEVQKTLRATIKKEKKPQ